MSTEATVSPGMMAQEDHAEPNYIAIWIYLAVVLMRGMSGKIPMAKAGLVEVAGLYWHFVDLVWILIFTFVYLI